MEINHLSNPWQQQHMFSQPFVPTQKPGGKLHPTFLYSSNSKKEVLTMWGKQRGFLYWGYSMTSCSHSALCRALWQLERHSHLQLASGGKFKFPPAKQF